MIPLVAAGVIGGAGSVLSGLFASGAAGKARRAAEREKARLQKKLNHLEIEEADISLANTLDTMRATGAGAGGATALAQAALRSKKGVSASIEAQEKSNEDKRAQGQQFMEQRQVDEQKRLQQADASGRAFVYGEQEKREQQQLDRTASLMGMAETVRAQSQADQTSAGLSMFGGVTDALGGIAAAGGFNKPPSK